MRARVSSFPEHAITKSVEHFQKKNADETASTSEKDIPSENSAPAGATTLLPSGA